MDQRKRNKFLREDPARRYLLAAVVAAELFMSFSFLGYIHIEPLSITMVYIPVLAAGILLGPKEAAGVGAVFGLASLWKASAFYVGAGDAIFSPVRSGKPLESLLLSVGTRTLFGLLSGLLFAWAKRRRHPLPWIAAAASAGRLLHTTLVYAAMGLFFPESGYGLHSVADDIRRWDFLPFTLVVAGVAVGCQLAVRSNWMRTLFDRVQEVDRHNALMDTHHRLRRWLVAALAFFASFAVAIYFTNRIETVMRQYQIKLNDEISYDLMHLQIQFLLGILSLGAMLLLAAMLYQKNVDYLAYTARLDGLTGLLGRAQFFQAGDLRLAACQEADPGAQIGCFLILDVDHFKQINDTCGHPAGDRVLRAVADGLRQAFGPQALYGRLGGDEFVVLLLEPLARRQVADALAGLKASLARIEMDGRPVTCSIGVIPAESGASMERLYRDADRLLYEAKKNGRDQTAFGYRFDEAAS